MALARFIEIVVLPTPPFWLMTAIALIGTSLRPPGFILETFFPEFAVAPVFYKFIYPGHPVRRFGSHSLLSILILFTVYYRSHRPKLYDFFNFYRTKLKKTAFLILIEQFRPGVALFYQKSVYFCPECRYNVKVHKIPGYIPLQVEI